MTTIFLRCKLYIDQIDLEPARLKKYQLKLHHESSAHRKENKINPHIGPRIKLDGCGYQHNLKENCNFTMYEGTNKYKKK